MMRPLTAFLTEVGSFRNRGRCVQTLLVPPPVGRRGAGSLSASPPFAKNLSEGIEAKKDDVSRETLKGG